MDSETTLRRVVNEISLALSAYAEQNGWKKDDYCIYYYVNWEWEGVYFVFVSEHFDLGDEKGNFKRVWDYLLTRFSMDRDILKGVTLMVWGKDQVDRGGLHSIPAGYREFWHFSPATHSPAL